MNAAQINPAQIIADSYAILSRGDPQGAEVMLGQLWNAGPPPPPPAVHLLGLIRRAQGRIGDAELLMRQSIEADPRNGEYRNNLGLLLRAAGFPDHAITAFEEALARDPKLVAARLNLARALDAAGRYVDAERQARHLLDEKPSAAAWTTLGGALRKQHRLADAIEAFDHALELDPKSFNARHDRAVAIDKSGRGPDAVAIFTALHGEGLRARELFKNWASALLDLGRADDAEARLAEALTHHPGDIQLHGDLARIRWLRGDHIAFTRDFEAAVHARPDDIALRVGCADMLRRGDRAREADRLLDDGLARAPGDPVLLAAFGVLRAETGDVAAAEAALLGAHAARPDDWRLRETLAATLLQAGKPAAALIHIRAARAAFPHNSAWLAHEAVALRMLGDERYRRVYDFDQMVRPYDLRAPEGFASIEAFNTALAETLRAMHTLDAHPIDQSLKNGTQTSKSLLEVNDPVIKAFLRLIDETLAAHIAAMPDDPDHPVWSRKPKSGRAKIVGCWSVRLRPGGYHVNHVHPEGWISSAYYVVVPPGVEGASDHQGWIQFGEPRWPAPGVTAERFVEPRAGRLVLFPSCMWHGTVAFREGFERLTIAFDAVPD